ncbi:MAG: YbaB/EbfC family nucleoid-associated protein [Alphaproteobacteria bacterium]|nr:YbaB/EbfC family nucleoid-associated protein [Alphaproteobacteria bacterium]
MSNNFSQILKQAQQMQEKLTQAQNKLNELEIIGTSGGGMVSVIISGKSEMKKVNIDPKLLSPDEAEIIGDLITAAYNDARSKLEAQMTEQMGGLLPSGMKLPF